MTSANLEDSLMAAAVAVPLLTALALGPRRWRNGVMGALPLAALPAVLLVALGQTNATVVWPGLGQHFLLRLDPVGRVFLGFTSVLWLASGGYARAYLANDANSARFCLFFLGSMAGNFTLILAGDIPGFYVGFALMGLASAGLVLHRGDPESARAGRVYLALAMVGEVLIFTGFVFLKVSGGTTQIADLHRGGVSPPAVLLLLIGFGIKAGALSLHFWLPLAHPAAPVPASAVLSGAMIKAGLLGWIRFLPLGEAALSWGAFVLIGAGLGAAFLGTFVGVAQSNPKTVLAYSSISQMGIITTGLGIGAVRPEAWPEIQAAVLIYAAHHALAKGALFLSIGPVQAARTRLQFAAARAGLLLPALALAGAPFTSGALAKVALKGNLAFLPSAWAGVLGILLSLAAVGTTLKMARFLWLTWPRPAPVAKAEVQGLWLPWLGLVAAVLAGVWLLPGALRWLPAKITPEKLWFATWPVVVGGGLAILAARLRQWFPTDPTRWLPPGDMGVLLERWLTRIIPRHTQVKPQHDPVPEDDANLCDAREAGFVAIWARDLARAEEALGDWPVAAVILLCLTGLILALLVAGPS